MVDDNKKGPVRPPILDAEAKKTSSADQKSTEKKPVDDKPKSTDNKSQSTTAKPADKKPSEPPKSAPPKSDDGEGGGAGTFIAAIVLSAALGMAGTAGLAYYKVFPFNQWAEQSDLAPEIAKLQKRIFDLENAQPDLSPFATQNDLKALQSEIEAIDTDQIEQAIANIESQLATISSPDETTTPVNLGPIESALNALEQDVANLKQTQQQLADRAASASNDSPTAQSGPEIDLSPLNDQLQAQGETLATQDETLGDLQKRVQTQSQELASLREEIAALQSQITTLEEDQSARQAADSAMAAARIPILMSEIDAAINNGQPFAARLEELTNYLKITPRDEIMDIAQQGLVPPSELLARYEALRPTLLAARPDMAEDAPWQDRLLGTLKDAVNLRPLNADGTDPLVLLDQIETALAAQRLARAQELIAQLPAPMQNAASPLATAIANHLLIEQWQTEMRTSLLNQNQQGEGDAQ
ncbi:hypothetical protein [Maritalea mediterranea]|uniref:Uncharacterized protein n=1 Tax=Maritalea mediterranea TaxID=2909667 RepID=A0ABS9EAS3_9HYPH|nr:hypothetical protein [Maritalea mediterranea]MCF4099968.1 hypothetical protein [Maritalea mediterranea]